MISKEIFFFYLFLFAILKNNFLFLLSLKGQTWEKSGKERSCSDIELFFLELTASALFTFPPNNHREFITFLCFRSFSFFLFFSSWPRRDFLRVFFSCVIFAFSFLDRSAGLRYLSSSLIPTQNASETNPWSTPLNYHFDCFQRAFFTLFLVMNFVFVWNLASIWRDNCGTPPPAVIEKKKKKSSASRTLILM